MEGGSVSRLTSSGTVHFLFFSKNSFGLLIMCVFFGCDYLGRVCLLVCFETMSCKAGFMNNVIEDFL